MQFSISADFSIYSDDMGEMSINDIYRQFDKFEAVYEADGLLLLATANRVEDVLLYLYCLGTGRPIMLVSADAVRSDLEDLLERFRPTYFVTSDHHAGKDVVDVLNHRAVKLANPATCAPALSLLLTTSGSTGEAKFVRLSIENVISNAEDIVSYLALTPEDVSITSLPIYYTYGLSLVTTAALSGARLVVTNAAVTQRQFWQLFESQGVTNLAGVPYTYELLEKLRFTRKVYGSLRLLTQAGGKLSSSIKRSFFDYSLENGIHFFVMYGQTEATARMAYVEPEMLPRKFESAGRALRSGRFEIVNADDRGVGEVVYFGPNVSLGYAKRSDDLNLGDCNGGKLLTGDLGYLDEDNYLYITGRKKRFLKLGGVRVGLDETEQRLEEEFAGCFVCTGADNDLRVFVEGAVDVAAVDIFLSQLLGVNRTFIAVSPVKEITRNQFGKKTYGS